MSAWCGGSSGGSSYSCSAAVMTGPSQRRRKISARLAVLVILAPLCNYGIWRHYSKEVGKWRRRIKNGSSSSSSSSTLDVGSVSETTIPISTATLAVLHISIPVVVQLSGELGNHLSKIASAVAIAMELERYNTNNAMLVQGMMQRLVHDEMKRAREERQTSNANGTNSNTITNGGTMPNITILIHISANLMLRHQDGTTKWQDSVVALQQCFPTLVNAFDVNSHASASALSMNDTFTPARTRSRPWRWNRRRRHGRRHGNDVSSRQGGAADAQRLDVFQASHYDVRALAQTWYNVGLDSDNATVVDDTLWRVVQDAIRASIRHIVNDSIATATSNRSSSSNNNYSNAILIDESIHNMTLYSNHLMHLDYRLDRYYSFFHDFFAVSPTCCTGTGTVNDDSSIHRRQPDDDEVVFYMRGFTTEMPRRGVRLGFEELEPSALVRVLREYYPSNTTTTTPNKIALLSRYAHRDDVMRPYVTALHDDGWTVRVIMSNQSMMQDFCFLQSSTFHSIGVARSTFFYWAALLGGPKTLDDEANDRQSNRNNRRRVVTLYSMNTTARRAWAESNHRGPQHGGVLESYNFTYASVLQRQWEFRSFTND